MKKLKSCHNFVICSPTIITLLSVIFTLAASRLNFLSASKSSAEKVYLPPHSCAVKENAPEATNQSSPQKASFFHLNERITRNKKHLEKSPRFFCPSTIQDCISKHSERAHCLEVSKQYHEFFNVEFVIPMSTVMVKSVQQTS